MNRILVQRLAEWIDPWDRLGISRTRQLHGRQQEYISGERYDERGRSYHQARIRYFVNQIRQGKQLDPIEVDNWCEGYSVYPTPVLLDGHHRFAAAILAGAKHIKCQYGGRVDLLRYLQGRRKNPPRE